MRQSLSPATAMSLTWTSQAIEILPKKKGESIVLACIYAGVSLKLGLTDDDFAASSMPQISKWQVKSLWRPRSSFDLLLRGLKLCKRLYVLARAYQGSFEGPNSCLALILSGREIYLYAVTLKRNFDRCQADETFDLPAHRL